MMIYDRFIDKYEPPNIEFQSQGVKLRISRKFTCRPLYVITGSEYKIDLYGNIDVSGT